MGLLVAALYGYLIVGVSKGRNSARRVILLLFVLGLIAAPPSWDAIIEAPVFGVFWTAHFSMYVAALFLIFTAPGKAWFAPRQAVGAG